MLNQLTLVGSQVDTCCCWLSLSPSSGARVCVLAASTVTVGEVNDVGRGCIVVSFHVC